MNTLENRKLIIQIEPWIDNEELEQLKRVIDSTYVVEHTLTKEFEELTKELTGAKHAIAITNGTAALYCCLKSLNIGEGDEVILPDLTFIASANAIIMAGAKPVFCDIDERTFCIDVDKAQSLVTSKTRTIMPVHLYGQAADMDKTMAFAKKNGLRVVEDAAQGVGVKYNNKHVGTFGDLGILSYYGNKTITCGEGGMILTNNDELAQKCYKLKNHGRAKKGMFIHEEIGYNFSFTEMQAAVGIAQMHKLKRIVEKKREINKHYNNSLKNTKGIEEVYIDPKCEPVFWFTSFIAERVEELAQFLSENKIQTRRFFYPLHLQPCYGHLHCDKANFPLTDMVFNSGISLPSSYHLGREDQDYVIAKIKEFYEGRH